MQNNEKDHKPESFADWLERIDRSVEEAAASLTSAPGREPPAETVEEAIDCLAEEDLYQFAESLSAARALLRGCRELVEATEFPERFRKILLNRGIELDDSPEAYRCEVLSPAHRESFRQRAIEMARHWILMEQ
ncbi:MAG TPA: hypothetical protein VIY49_17205 [Bryobacteraceae bacterium]